MGMVLRIKNTNIRLLPGNFKIHHFQLIEKQNFLPKGNPDNSKLIFVPKYWISRVWVFLLKFPFLWKIFWTSEIFNLSLMIILEYFSLAQLKISLCLPLLPLVTFTSSVLCRLAPSFSLERPTPWIAHIVHKALPWWARQTNFGVMKTTCKGWSEEDNRNVCDLNCYNSEVGGDSGRDAEP